MAATTIRELLTKLGVQADTLAVQRFDAALNIAKKTMLLTAGAALTLTGALVGATIATARQGDEAAKAAARVGITAQEMQELGFAAEQSGAKLVDIEVAMRRQATAARDAAKGTGIAAESYKELGVNVLDVNGLLKPQLQLLEETADALPGVATETRQLAIINDIFGRGGAKIRPLLKQGAEGIRAFREEARELGFVLDEEATKASEDFVDGMNATRLVLVGLRNQIGKQLIPVFTTMLSGFRDFISANRMVIRQRIDRFMEKVRKAIDFARAAFQRINRVVVEDLGSWDAIFQQIDKSAKLSGAIAGLTVFIALVKAARLALLGVQASLLANPIGLAIAAAVVSVIALTLAIDDLVVFANGGKSSIGDFLDAMDPALAEEFRATLLDVRDALRDLGAMASDTLVPIFRALGLEVETIGEIFETIFGTVVLAEVERVNSVLQGFVELLRRVPGFLTAISGGGLEGLINPPEVERRNRRSLFDALGGGGLAGLGQQALGTPAAAAGAGGATSVVFQGDTNNFTGSDLSRAEVEQILDQRQAKKNRQAIAASRGGDR